MGRIVMVSRRILGGDTLFRVDAYQTAATSVATARQYPRERSLRIGNC
jgi:hypothetical protein